jgi:hypothetical protein
MRRQDLSGVAPEDSGLASGLLNTTQQVGADVQTVALSFTRCPGAPYCGHLVRAVAFGRYVRTRLAHS